MPEGGDVTFSVDLSTGLVHIGVRPPYSLESGRVTAAVSILEFLDQAAKLTLTMNQVQREVMAQLGHGHHGQLAAGVPT